MPSTARSRRSRACDGRRVPRSAPSPLARTGLPWPKGSVGARRVAGCGGAAGPIRRPSAGAGAHAPAAGAPVTGAVPAWRAYSQAQLDAQYDQTTLVPDPGPHVERWAERSRALRSAHPPLALRHGPHEREVVDLFLPSGARPRALHVHVHGGAWRSLSRDAVSLMAGPLLARGVAFAAPGFPLAPEASLGAMVASVASALDLLAAQAARLGLAPGAVGLSGFSSGAHLAAMALAERPRAAPLGATLASGIYDLDPVRLSARNAYLHLDEAEARRLSPIAREMPRVPLTILAGTRELDEFRRQARDFAAHLRALGHAVEAVEVSGTNHFETFDALCDADGPLMAGLIARHTAQCPGGPP